jgi:hypothetical protein
VCDDDDDDDDVVVTDGRNQPHRRTVLPDKFDGTVNLRTYLDQFQLTASYNCWSNRDKANFLLMSLRGSASQCVSECVRRQASFSQVVDTLEKRFGTKDQDAAYRAQLKARRRRRGESQRDLYLDIDRLVGLSYPGEHSTQYDAIAVDAFCDSLDDPELEQRLRDKDPVNLEEAHRFAIKLESHRVVRKSD